MTSINLNKDNAGPGSPATLEGVTKLRFGAQWDPSARGKGGFLGRLSSKGGADLDLIAVLMQGDKPVKYVGLDNLDPVRGSIVHSGDETKGNKEGDDEMIDVDFTQIPFSYDAVFFTASVFKSGGMDTAMQDKGFQGAKNVEFHLYNMSSGQPVMEAEIMPDLAGTQNCCLIAKVSRTVADDASAPWKIEVYEEMISFEKGSMPALLNKVRGR
jgi:tellurium resistance protein TerZ